MIRAIILVWMAMCVAERTAPTQAELDAFAAQLKPQLENKNKKKAPSPSAHRVDMSDARMWEQWSAAIGLRMGKAWKSMGLPVEVTVDDWCKGFEEAVKKVPSGARAHGRSDDEVQAFMDPLNAELEAETARVNGKKRYHARIAEVAKLVDLLADPPAEMSPEQVEAAEKQRDALQRQVDVGVDADWADEAQYPLISAANQTLFSYVVGWSWAQQFPNRWPLDFVTLCKVFETATVDESQVTGYWRDDVELEAIGYYMTNGITYEKKLRQQMEIEETFLKKNKEVEGVSVTPSGVQWMRKGPTTSGEMVTDAHVVTYHVVAGRHRGRQAVDTGAFVEDAATAKLAVPMKDRVADLVSGFREGIQLMRVGERVKFWLPSNTAFGDKFGLVGDLFPRDVLMLDVLVVAVEPAEPKEEDADGSCGSSTCDNGPNVDFSLTSPAFRDGAQIPGRFTCEGGRGGNYSPPLKWTNVPAGTKSFVIHMTKKTADGPVSHWLMYDVPATKTDLLGNALAEGGAKLGASYLGEHQAFYVGPCPERDGARTQTFEITLYALDVESVSNNRADNWPTIEETVNAHILQKATLSFESTKGEGKKEAWASCFRQPVDDLPTYF